MRPGDCVVGARASADGKLGAVLMAPDLTRTRPVRTIAQRIRRVLATAAALVTAAACSSPTSVPKGYVKLHFNTWPQPWTTESVPVGAHLAVEAINGDKAAPRSESPLVVQAEDWTGHSSPSHWYAFKAVSPGTATIQEILPCKATACAAGQALITITVMPKA